MEAKFAVGIISPSSTSPPPAIEPMPLDSGHDVPLVDSPATVRRRFRIKFVSGNTVYIDGGSNSGLRVGMNLDLSSASANTETTASDQAPIGAARLVGIATTSAILEVGTSSSDLHVGDWAELLPADAETARKMF